jgi:hypothetical protein
MKSKISEVHVVFKTHLDIGFTDMAAKVVSRYFKNFIPQALALAKATRSSPDRFVWTTGSWLAYRFLEDASRRDRMQMEEAIAEGDFHWHALPFTTHTELLSPDLFRMGLEYSKRLDDRFGRKTIAAKMTDVPGHTLGIVPLLADAGIRLLHIGVNPTSAVPQVPNLFRWRAGRDEIVVIYEPVYGSTTRLPGGDYLSMNLTNDNLGPPIEKEIGQVYDDLRRKYSGARIQAGNIDRVAKIMWKNRERLPVVTSEIGDTWIHGVGTDPQKVSRFRELERLRSEWIQKGLLKAKSEVDFRLCENLLLVAEHTWGMDIKTHLRDRKAWSPRQLRASIVKPRFQAVVTSWQEQRAYLEDAVKALPKALRLRAQSAFYSIADLPPPDPSRRIKVGEKFTLGPWEIRFDSHGAISWLKKNNCQHADRSHRLGGLVYQTFSSHDYQRFFRQYCRLQIDWCAQDFTKPGMSGSRSLLHRPRVRRIEVSKNNEVIHVILGFAGESRKLGAPKEVICEVRAHESGINLRLSWSEKPSNRLPEALWLSFRPTIAKCDWRFEKVGLKIDPVNVVKRGNRHLHAVTGEITCGDFSMRSLDAVLFSPGQPKLLDFSPMQPDLNRGIASILYNNVWGTNFPMWYSDDASFRYELRWRNH